MGPKPAQNIVPLGIKRMMGKAWKLSCGEISSALTLTETPANMDKQTRKKEQERKNIEEINGPGFR